MTEVEPRLKPDYEPCPCGCGATGAPLKNGHPRTCDRTRCLSCRNRGNRNRGRRKQARARKLIGVPDNRFASSHAHEELWRGAFRVEVKAGAQVRPIATRFLAMEAQSDQSKAFGDSRAFLGVAMPEGMDDGIVLLRASVWQRHIAPLIDEAGGVA